MSSSQFLLAYACVRADEMSEVELRHRIDMSTEHVDSLFATSIEGTHVGDGRTGFVAWNPVNGGAEWPAAVDAQDYGAAWLHVPAAANGRDDGVDPVRLARDVTGGLTDRSDMGAPAAAVYWDREGLRIVNDRLGMVRLYEFDVPGFGRVWSSRPGIAHVFSGLSPRLEQATWSDMATLGWASRGQAHLGNGAQLPASTTIRANSQGNVEHFNDRDEWIAASIEGDVPSLSAGGAGMVRSLAVTSWWPGRPLADLSGGKDSRVTAAAAIRAGAVDTVRTVNTDIGEVDAARELLALAENPVEHRVDPVVEPKAPEGGVFERYLSMQRAWEGAYNARSAYRSNKFTGFRAASAPRINGLGGEAIQGRTLLSPGWREKMEGQNSEGGRARLAQMVRSGAHGVAEAQIQESLRSVGTFVDESRTLGYDSAFMAIDYFYHFSKMPYWSMPQGTQNSLLPFYSPQMLPRTMWSIANASEEYGGPHREILRRILPAWADVPFYKGSARTRTTPWMWENRDWNEMSSVILNGIGSLDTFSASAFEDIVREASSGDGNVRHELALTRAMWELSFKEYSHEIALMAKRTAVGVEKIRARVALR